MSDTRSFEDPITSKKIVYGDVVKRGLKWLIDHQSDEGAIGPLVGEMMYNHALATLALAEACMTDLPTYREPTQKAVDYLQRGQNYGLGWRYTPKSGNNDSSITGWCVKALRAAQTAGLEVQPSTFEGAKAWFVRVTDAHGQAGYDRLGSGEIFVPGKNEQWRHHPTMTAVALSSRILIDRRKDPALARSASLIVDDMPRWDRNVDHPSVDFYYWYHGTVALIAWDSAGDATQRWSAAITQALCPSQRIKGDGCLEGSWDTGGVDRWAYAGGRTYGTAMAVLTLERLPR